MADVFLTLDEVAKQLQLSKDQVTEMVKKNLLRGFLDQKTYKVRQSDVEAFKKKLASGATTLSEGAPMTGATPAGGRDRRDVASKIDLTEVEGDSGEEDNDQTSVLAPAEPNEPGEKPPEKPVFQFGAKDLESHEQEPPALDEDDQTSLLVPDAAKKAKGKDESKAAFDFAEKDLKAPSEPEEGAADSVLVADESESSMDILEVAEESSSDSASSASGIAFSDEVSSGEEIEAAAETPSQFAQKPAAKPAPRSGEPTTDKVVTNILGPAAGEESDEALETLDVDEVVETKETDAAEPGAKPETAETVPVGDEYETVGLPGAEETKGAMGETGETVGVDGAVAAALQEQAAEEGPEEAEAAAEEGGPGVVPAGWETAQPWPIGNGLLIAATVILIVGGAMLFCESFGIHNGLTTGIANMVKSHMH